MTNASSSSASLWPFVRFAPVSPCDCCNRWTQNWTWDARFDLTKVEWKIPVTSHKLPWHCHSCLVHPMLLAFFPQVHITSAWSTYCPPSAFLQSCFAAGPHSVCTTLLLPLMNLLKFLLSLFLKTLEVPLNGSTTDQHISHSWQFHIVSKLAANALCPVTQVTNEEANLWGTTVVTGLRLGFMLLISTLWVQQISQFLIHITVCLSCPCFITLPMGMLWRIVLKALLKSSQINI